MGRSKLRVSALLVAASLVLLGAGCAGGGGGAVTLAKVGNLEKTTLNVSVLANLDSAGFFVALHEGLFAQEGLRINYSPAFGDNVAPLARGRYDIIGMNYVTYIEDQLAHVANLRIFAEGSTLLSGDDVIMVMPHSRIQSLQDLKGRVLGVNTVANIGFLLVASMLTQAGLRFAYAPGHSAKSVLLPADPNFPFPATQPLISGQVAAAIMSEPFATELAEQSGAGVISDANAGATSHFPILGYAATKAWAQANPNTLKAFTIALEAGQEIADTDRAAVEAAFVALPQGEGHVDQRTAALMALGNYRLGVDPVRLQRVADEMQQFGLIKQHFSIGQLLN